MVFRSNLLTIKDIAQVFNESYFNIYRLIALRDTTMEKLLTCKIPKPVKKVGRYEYYDETSLESFEKILKEIETNKKVKKAYNFIFDKKSEEQKKLLY